MRLRDEQGATDATLAECARLVRASSSLDPNGVMEARVRRAVLQGKPRHLLGMGRWWPALALVFLFAIISTAAALIGKYRGWSKPSAVAIALPSHARVAEAPTILPPVSPMATPIGEAAPQISRTVLASASTRQAARKRVATRTPSQPAPMVAAAPRSDAPAAVEPAVASPAEAKLVMDAIAALRNAHDAAAAREKFDRYLRQYPDGALTEEVIAYSIEAARDATDIAVRCQQYLDRYPHGRFVSVARRALAKVSDD